MAVTRPRSRLADASADRRTRAEEALEDATNSVDITGLGSALRRVRSTASVAAHARRHPQNMGVRGGIARALGQTKRQLPLAGRARQCHGVCARLWRPY